VTNIGRIFINTLLQLTEGKRQLTLRLPAGLAHVFCTCSVLWAKLASVCVSCTVCSCSRIIEMYLKFIAPSCFLRTSICTNLFGWNKSLYPWSILKLLPPNRHVRSQDRPVPTFHAGGLHVLYSSTRSEAERSLCFSSMSSLTIRTWNTVIGCQWNEMAKFKLCF